MKQVLVVEWCDYPNCANDAQDAQAEELGNWVGQQVHNVDFWVNVYGGRKTKPVKVVFCEEHAAEMRAMYAKVAKFDQKEDEGDGDDT